VGNKKQTHTIGRRAVLGLGALVPAAVLLGGAAETSNPVSGGRYIKQARIEFGGVEPVDVRATMTDVVAKPLAEILSEDVMPEDLLGAENDLNSRIHRLVKEYCTVIPRAEVELIRIKPVLLGAVDDNAELIGSLRSGEMTLTNARMNAWANFSRYLSALENILPYGL
jgi:hypothetical protein